MSVSTNITTFIDTESRTGLVRGWGRGGELVFNGFRVSVLWMIGDDSCTTLGIYLMPWICTFKNGHGKVHVICSTQLNFFLQTPKITRTLKSFLNKTNLSF